VKKEGNDVLLFKLNRKYEYLNSRINDIEEEILAASG